MKKLLLLLVFLQFGQTFMAAEGGPGKRPGSPSQEPSAKLQKTGQSTTAGNSSSGPEITKGGLSGRDLLRQGPFQPNIFLGNQGSGADLRSVFAQQMEVIQRLKEEDRRKKELAPAVIKIKEEPITIDDSSDEESGPQGPQVFHSPLPPKAATQSSGQAQPKPTSQQLRQQLKVLEAQHKEENQKAMQLYMESAQEKEDHDKIITLRQRQAQEQLAIQDQIFNAIAREKGFSLTPSQLVVKASKAPVAAAAPTAVEKLKERGDYVLALSEQGPFECTFPECGKKFKTREICKRHIGNSHLEPEQAMFVCDHCGKNYPKKNKNRHLEICSTKQNLPQAAQSHLPQKLEKYRNECYKKHYQETIEENENRTLFRCNLCEKKIDKKDTALKHSRGHWAETHKVYFCGENISEDCKRSFSRKEHLVDHFMHCSHKKSKEEANQLARKKEIQSLTRLLQEKEGSTQLALPAGSDQLADDSSDEEIDVSGLVGISASIYHCIFPGCPSYQSEKFTKRGITEHCQEQHGIPAENIALEEFKRLKVDSEKSHHDACDNDEDDDES